MSLEMFVCIQSICFVFIMVAAGLMLKFSIDVALHRYPKHTSDNSDYAKCSNDLFELQSKYEGLLPKETIIRILKKHFA